MIPSVEETKNHPRDQPDNNQVDRDSIDNRITEYIREHPPGVDPNDLEHIDDPANYDRILIQREPDRQTRIAECMGLFSICVIMTTFIAYLTGSGSS